MRAAVLLVGQYALFRHAIGRILPASRFQIVASVETIEDATTGLAAGDSPSLMILMTEEEPSNTYRQIAGFRTWSPSGRILIVARRSQKRSVLGALQAGADGCIWDLSDSRAFLSAVDLVLSGVCILPPELLSAALLQLASDTPPDLAPRPPPRPQPEYRGSSQLSDQEFRTLAFLREGDTNKSIACKLSISESTVKVHVKSILRKIQVANRTQAAIWAMNQLPDQLPEGGPQYSNLRPAELDAIRDV
jgi:two-component system nitrate/nitrite response regulator NarL